MVATILGFDGCGRINHEKQECNSNFLRHHFNKPPENLKSNLIQFSEFQSIWTDRDRLNLFIVVHPPKAGWTANAFFNNPSIDTLASNMKINEP